MLLERAELIAPERLDLGEPRREVAERLGSQPVHAAARVGLLVARLLDEPAHPQHAQVSAHRGWTHPERVGELARAARLPAQQLDDAPPGRIGERRERAIERDFSHGYFSP